MKPVIKSLKDIFQLSASYQIARLIQAAVKLDVFTHTENPVSAKALAKKLKADERAVEISLDALSSAGLLIKRAEGYVNSKISNRYLNAGSLQNKVNIIKHHSNCFLPWLKLEDTIITGSSHYASSNTVRDENEINDFIKGMNDMASELVPSVLKSLRFSISPRKILDLGGGPATYSIAFGEKFPFAQVCCFDMKIPVRIAKENIKKTGVKNVSVIEGDFFVNEIGENYDFVWVSQIIHSLDEGSIVRLFKKVKKSMKKGGKVVVHEFLLDENKTKPFEAALFSVHMLAVTKGGRSYSGKEVSSFLKEAGFSKIRIKRRVTAYTGFVDGTA